MPEINKRKFSKVDLEHLYFDCKKKKKVIYDVEKLEPSFIAGGNVKIGADAVENTLVAPQKVKHRAAI